VDAHDGSPKAASLSPDGGRLITGASDGVVRIWDTGSGDQVHEIRLAGTEAQGVAFSGPDEVAVLGGSGQINLYTTQSDRLLELVRGSLTRAFTQRECQRYGLDPCPTLEDLRSG
jgi:WD40 repeat protein